MGDLADLTCAGSLVGWPGWMRAAVHVMERMRGKKIPPACCKSPEVSATALEAFQPVSRLQLLPAVAQLKVNLPADVMHHISTLIVLSYFM